MHFWFKISLKVRLGTFDGNLGWDLGARAETAYIIQL
jgi:hypothetical protein